MPPAIDLPTDSTAASALAVRLDEPAASAPARDVALLYLHGFASSQSGEKAEFFRRRAVDAGYPFCSFDFRGHGASGGELRELTLSRNLEDVDRVAAHLAGRGFERLALVGSSMGGATALWSAALHPDRYVAAVHIAPAVALERSLLAWAGPEGAHRWRQEGTIRLRNGEVETDLDWGLIDDLRAYPLERLIATYRTPTLLFQGKNDASVSWRDVLDFAVRCPYEQIELRLYADGDHRLIDRKDEIWRGMAHFLERAAGGAGGPTRPGRLREQDPE